MPTITQVLLLFFLFSCSGAYEDGQVVDKLPKAAAFLGKGIAQSAALLGPKVASSAQELHSALQQFSLLKYVKYIFIVPSIIISSLSLLS